MFRLMTYISIFLLIGPVFAAKVVVNTEQGMVIGVDESDVKIFKGIPYAASPAGEARWQPARDAMGWVGGLVTTEFSHDCIQPMTAEKNSLFYLPQPLMSEDCLFLNIWAPNNTENNPVIVWIHGGGLMDGSSSLPIYNGLEISRKGICLVSFKYRLNVFG